MPCWNAHTHVPHSSPAAHLRGAAARLFGAVLCLSAVAVYGQPGSPAQPALQGLRPLSEVPVLETPAVARSASRSDGDDGRDPGPVPFAEPFAVDVTPLSHGGWEFSLDGGFAVWRLRVSSPGAVSLNLGFTRYRMPPGGSLRFFAADGSESAGPYTEADNEEHGELWTPVVAGSEAVIEVVVPAVRGAELELELTAVNRGFRDFPPAVVTSPGHASCHVDVVCAAADPWRDQVRSVGTFTIAGRDLCTGYLVNNTARDRTPWFMTAFHCILVAGDLPSTIVVYWNYESPTCGARSGGSKAQNQSGAELVARNWTGDFALLRLDDDVDPAHNLFFAGWNADPAPPSSAVQIHHPQAHVKSINTTSRPLTVTGYRSSERESGRYLRVLWDSGIAESGSSGSPYFGPDGRVVGTHRGGDSECSKPNSADWASRLANDWFGRGTPQTRLMDWLDPLGTGERAIDGMPANYPPEAAGTLHDKAIRLADGSVAGALAVDVAHGFLDRDRDALTYTASSSDESIVTETISGSTVTVTPVAEGTATITVTATDGKSDPVSRTFSVTVGTNRSPEPVGTLAALALRVEDGASSVDVATAFQDVDGDALTYAASSSDESVATVSVSGSTVTVTPVSGGSAMIAVTATDAGGSATSARQSFKATVVNRAPVATAALVDLTLRVGEAAATVDAAAVFADADGDALKYSASSSNGSVATVSLKWGELTVKPVGGGTAEITVTATDVVGSNQSASRSFDVVVPGARGVTAAPSDVDVQEGGSASYTIVLTALPTGTVTVTPSVPPNTDVSVDPTQVEFGVADWDSPVTVTVRAAEDGDALIDATVTITHAASGADYGSVTAPSVTVSIAENDEPTLSVAAARAAESGSLEFEVAQDIASSFEAAVAYATSDGTAVAGSDYAASRGWLTFPEGSATSQRIVVDIVDDAEDEEEEETLLLTLSNARNAALAGGGSTLEATGTIEDDDDPAVEASFGSSSYFVTEGGTATVDVVLDRDPERDLRISLARTHRGGASSADYSAPSSVSFASGETHRTFKVSATDDTVDDDDESVELSFRTPLPGRVTASGGGTEVVIEDDDDPAVVLSFGASRYFVREGGTATVEVRLNRDPERFMEILLERTESGGATSADYSAPSSVSFGSGETRRTFEVAVVDDAEDDDVRVRGVALRGAAARPGDRRRRDDDSDHRQRRRQPASTSISAASTSATPRRWGWSAASTSTSPRRWGSTASTASTAASPRRRRSSPRGDRDGRRLRGGALPGPYRHGRVLPGREHGRCAHPALGLRRRRAVPQRRPEPRLVLTRLLRGHADGGRRLGRIDRVADLPGRGRGTRRKLRGGRRYPLPR